jgi:UDP-glucose-4-epimerase GalE
MCKNLHAAGYTPIVVDNLSRGHRAAVQWGPFIQGNMDDTALLERVFSRYPIEAVMHFAAFAYVGESVDDPGLYYRNNVAAPIILLQQMARHGVKRFIFSSTCAIYGEPVAVPMDEKHPKAPINPYGRGKLMIEQVLDDFRHGHGIASMCLRYFNAAGADPEGLIGEDHRPETHLIPLALEVALGKRDTLTIFGEDYPTPDGTCIRDYIHIKDLARAHLLALEKMKSAAAGSAKYNLGNGNGYSVKEVLETARAVTGHAIPARIGPRRPGDPARLVGSSDLARQELGWEPRYPDLKSIVETAWNWHKNHPDGFGEEK